MKDQLNKSKVGLTLGVFFAAWHALWAILVGIGWGQTLIDLILPLHFLDSLYYKITAFNFSTAVILIVLAFVSTYILGWLFAALWNWMKVK